KSAGQTFTITYGSKASGGPGADAPLTPGPYAWTAQEQSTENGPPLDLAVSPSIMLPLVTIESTGVNGCTVTRFCYRPFGVPAGQPANFGVSNGSTVTWGNLTGSTHDVDRCIPALCQGVGPGSGTDSGFGGSPDLPPQAQYTWTFNGSGDYNFFCSIHGYAVMHG